MTPEEIYNESIDLCNKLQEKKQEQINIYIEIEKMKKQVYNLIKK